MKHFYPLLAILLFLTLAAGCREQDTIFIPEEVTVTTPLFAETDGFFLLNEGNMGSNKATLDRFEYSTGVYTRNIFGMANPDVPKELGDVGNDLAIYGSKMYAVVNCSNKVEVMDAHTARRIGQIDIPNCRRIRFSGPYAYVTSYAGPVEINPDYTQRGYVAKVDTATLQVVDTCLVGFQPDGLEIAGSKIYVCNSGGYMVPNYENTISVIDLDTFREEGRVEIAINLDRIVADRRGRLWISSRGNYYGVSSALYCYDTRKQRLVHSLPIPVGDMTICGDSIYVVANSFSFAEGEAAWTSAIVDTETASVMRNSLVTDGSQTAIRKPYCIAVNPVTHEIYITDARTFVNPGWLYCYSPEGSLRWSVRTGDAPAHITFTGLRKK